MRGEGKAACVAFYGSWFDAFPDAHVEVHGVHFIDELAVEEGTFTGTHNGVLHGPMGDIPPTGRSVRLDYIQVLRFRNGKHVSFNLMFDRLLMLEQLGLSPHPRRDEIGRDYRIRGEATESPVPKPVVSATTGSLTGLDSCQVAAHEVRRATPEASRPDQRASESE